MVFATTNGVPFAVTEKDTAPSFKAGCNKILIIAAQIAPKEAGAFENVDLRHVEIGSLRGISLWLSFPDIAT